MGFTGQRYDDITNCYLLGNGYRGFNPKMMRFLSPDSFSPFGSRTLNAYAYCKGDPINRHDPSGHILERIKAAFSKPKIYYRTKARSAIDKYPVLNKYSTIADDPEMSIDALKAIYKIPEAETRLEHLREIALERLTTANFEEHTANRTSKLDYGALLEFDESLRYTISVSKVIKYRSILDNFVPLSHGSFHQTSAASPQTERTSIRSPWVTFED
jgi:RHS repeat-associated protein